MEEAAVMPIIENCPTCKKAVSPEAKFCDSCGYPVGGSTFDKNEFEYAYEVKRYELEKAQGVVKNGVTTLYVLSGLILLADLVVYYTTDNVGFLIAGILLPVMFVGLAQWAKVKPFTALVVALVLYVTLILSDVFVNPASIVQGIILKIIVISALVKAVRGAKDAQNIMGELEAKNWNQ
ncbi:MAG TPA: zinc ribbon domain-containing protein [Chitinophagales bacterium]|nr:zinc ribbon domain-containing protein [Chitinophagales bacterium]